MLKRHANPRLKQDLVFFFRGLGMYLASGVDLSEAWPGTLESLQGEIEETLFRHLKLQESERPFQAIRRLSLSPDFQTLAPWLDALAQHFREGLSVLDCLDGVVRFLENDAVRTLARWERELPMRSNLLLLLFFFPATALLLFAPLILALSIQL